MQRTAKFKYHVIQFLELPYEGIDKYICVPWSWILLRRKFDQKVIVSYPVENPSDTVKRVKKRQKPSDDWELCLSNVEYSTDLYEDAIIFINGKMNDVDYVNKCSNPKNRDQELSAPVKKTTRRSKRNSKSNYEIDKPLDLDVTSKNNDKSKTKRLKRTALPTSDIETESVSNAAEQPSQDVTSKNNDKSKTKRLKRTALPTLDTETESVSNAAEQPNQDVTSKNNDKSKTKRLKRPALPTSDTETESVSNAAEQPNQDVTSKNNDKSKTKRLKRTALPTSDTETESVSNAAEQPNQDVTSKNNDKSKTKRLKRTALPTSDTETESVSNAAEQPNQDVTSKNNDKSKTKRLKRTALPTSDTETESVSNAAEQPSHAIECLSDHQRSPTQEDFPMQNSCSSDISVENSNDRNCVEEIEQVENNEQERPSVTQSPSNITNSLSNPQQTIDPTFFKELLTVLRNHHTVSANSYSVISSLRRIIIENTEALKDVKQLIVNGRSNIDIPTTSSSTNTAEIEKISEKNQSKQQQQQEEYANHDDDTNEVPKKKCFKKRKFVLPPEYDEDDSRWTLKHRESAPGVVELLPHTNVYINSLALSNCKRLSKDCKSLARMLLVEIFTKNALTICSITGLRARAYDVEGANVRPGLDENARTVLLAYVEEYRREKGWITLDTQSILNSIRNKMQEFRFKYG